MRTGTALTPATPPEKPVDLVPILVLVLGFGMAAAAGALGHWHYAALITGQVLQAFTAYCNRGRGSGR